MNEQTHEASDLSRRRFLKSAAAGVRRINNFFAPVISSDNFVQLLQQSAGS
jgi:hypothetical protein